MTRHVTDKERRFIRKMTGYWSMNEIAKWLHRHPSTIRRQFDRMAALTERQREAFGKLDPDKLHDPENRRHRKALERADKRFKKAIGNMRFEDVGKKTGASVASARPRNPRREYVDCR